MTTALVGLLGTFGDCYSPGNDGNTKLLIHGTESVTAGDFTDTTGVHTVSFNGTQSDFSSANNKSGFGKNIYFDGTGDYLSIGSHADWDFGTGDYTVDYWIYFTGWGSYGGWLSINGNEFFIFINTDSGDLIWGINGQNEEFRVIDWQLGASLNQWYHFAMIGYNGTLFLYIDGVNQINDTGYSTAVVDFTHGAMVVGRRYSASDVNYFTGYMDEIRISKGVARWVSNFTPPVHPYCNNK